LLRKSGRLASQYAADDKLNKVLENPQVVKTPVVRNGKQSTLGYLPKMLMYSLHSHLKNLY